MTAHEDRLRLMVACWPPSKDRDAAEWAVAEIDRLRAALAVFADPSAWDQYSSDCYEWDRDGSPIDLARRALEGIK